MGNSEKMNGFLNKARETLSWERREADLEQKLLETIEHAFERSSAYKEIFNSSGIRPSEIRGLEDLEKLPILRMSDLVERQKAEPHQDQANLHQSRPYLAARRLGIPGYDMGRGTLWRRTQGRRSHHQHL